MLLQDVNISEERPLLLPSISHGGPRNKRVSTCNRPGTTVRLLLQVLPANLPAYLYYSSPHHLHLFGRQQARPAPPKNDISWHDLTRVLQYDLTRVLQYANMVPRGASPALQQRTASPMTLGMVSGHVAATRHAARKHLTDCDMDTIRTSSRWPNSIDIFIR